MRKVLQNEDLLNRRGKKGRIEFRRRREEETLERGDRQEREEQQEEREQETKQLARRGKEKEGIGS